MCSILRETTAAYQEAALARLHPASLGEECNTDGTKFAQV
jgi:hypothetical protein